MSEKSLEPLIKNAASSVEMEGYVIDAQSREWCKKLLKNEITMSKYIELIKKKSGAA